MAFIMTDLGTIEREVARLEKMANAPKFMAPVMKRIMIDMARVTGELIKSEGRRGGGSYARLKEKTVEKKGSVRILYTVGAESGYSELGNDTLVRSVTNKTAANIYSVREYTATTITFGTTRPWAESHQYGAPRRNIPARPFLRFTEYDVARWKGMMTTHLFAPHVRK